MYKWDSSVFIIDYDQVFSQAKFFEKLTLIRIRVWECICKHSKNNHGHYSNVLTLDSEKAFKIIPQALRSEVEKVLAQLFLQQKCLVSVTDYFPYWSVGTIQPAGAMH